jgi:hypothetical protein
VSKFAIKLILGVLCVILGLFHFLVVFANLEPPGMVLRATSHLIASSILLAFALCGGVLVANGALLTIKSNSKLPLRIQAVIAISLAASFVTSVGLSRYVQSHKMSAAERIEEDLKLLQDAVKQPTP